MTIKAISQSLQRFVLVSLGIIFLSSGIGLFTDGINMSLSLLIHNLFKIISYLFHPSEMTIQNTSLNEYPLFPTFWSYYYYSLIVFLFSLSLAIIVGLFLSYLTILLPQRVNAWILRLTELLEVVPDIFIIIVIQFSVIFLFKKTGILLFPIAGASEPVYFLPIVTLSILPSLFIYRLALLLIHDELKEPYVELARSKGYSITPIFFHHILRNIANSFVNHMKTIILFLLSSLIIFERLFNIYGITHFIFSFSQMEVIAFSLMMFYLPIFLLFLIASIWLQRVTGEEVKI
ncbi:ABC transporter permease subunit [Rossellomorea aquimaris]|uniref:ABC transporter permease subunit n=1 Tax=Rossellomorea aquimaris TaxID=189382 RepID=UPI0007D05084|nr:ABC transporter permease subunit [Rossellomorea aquimaris]